MEARRLPLPDPRPDHNSASVEPDPDGPRFGCLTIEHFILMEQYQQIVERVRAPANTLYKRTPHIAEFRSRTWAHDNIGTSIAP